MKRTAPALLLSQAGPGRAESSSLSGFCSRSEHNTIITRKFNCEGVDDSTSAVACAVVPGAKLRRSIAAILEASCNPIDVLNEVMHVPVAGLND